MAESAPVTHYVKKPKPAVKKPAPPKPPVKKGK
jgi:hypothetical protein